MPDFLRREYAQLLTSGAQLLLVLIGIRLNTHKAWMYCLLAIAVVSVFAWLSSLYRLRTLRDTPTSRIASAAQGYVEIIGRGQPVGGMPLLSELSRLPCLWCRYKIEQRDGERDWRKIDSGETSDSFMLRDDTGECVIDPEHAEISTQHYKQWVDEDCRYTEWNLIQHDQIYVIGEFRTQNAILEFDFNAQLSALLAEWKKDMPALLARFDLNKDGVLDMDEWMLARQAAKREVEKMMKEAQAAPDMNFIGRPSDGRLFLISNLSQKKLTRRYLLWTWGHLLIFFASLGGLGWMLQ